jgi:hypothetical protein
VTQPSRARKPLTMAKALEVRMLPHLLLQRQRLDRLNRMRQRPLTRKRVALRGAEGSLATRHHQHPRSRDGSRIASHGASPSERKIAKAKVTREEVSLVVPLSKTLTPTKVLQVLTTGQPVCETLRLLAVARMASRATVMCYMIHVV